MMLFRRSLVLTALLICVLQQAPPGSACSCGPVPTPAEALEQAHAVFSGTVKEIEGLPPGGTPLRVAFRADRWWKGGEGATVSIVTSDDEAACGFHFEDGEAYLVFAYGDNVITDETGYLVAGICSRTKRLSEAQEELPELGPAITAVAPTWWGRIKALFR